ncbi:hypothetical protein V8D89_002204 [Ganoderma adspersum]
MNAVSRTITTVITTHPFVPNFGGEVDFSPIKLGPVTTFRAHSVYTTGKGTEHPLKIELEHPGVIDAIVSIRSLRSLSIESTDAVAVSFISKTCAPLRILDVSSSFQEVEKVQFCWYPAAFRDSFSRLAPTLQELSFRFLFVDPDIIQEIHREDFNRPAPPLSSWEQYPSLRSLSVRCLVGRLLLEPLQHLFPALDGTFSLALTDLRRPEDTFPDILAINRRRRPRPRGWTKLDRVACGPAAFYILALCCPIRLAIIEGILGVYAPHLERDWIAVSLRENPVARLTLGLRLDDELVGLDGLFGPEMGATLTHLSLTLETEKIGRWPDPLPPVGYSWGELLDKVLSSLEPLHKLTHLRIIIHSESPEHADSDAFEPFTPAEYFQRAIHPSIFDYQGTARALARPLPSLQFLSLTTCGRFFLYEEDRDPITQVLPQPKRWAASRAWSVPKRNADAGLQNGEPSLVELQDEEAEDIIEREELVLPDELYNKAWLAPHVDIQ